MTAATVKRQTLSWRGFHHIALVTPGRNSWELRASMQHCFLLPPDSSHLSWNIHKRLLQCG